RRGRAARVAHPRRRLHISVQHDGAPRRHRARGLLGRGVAGRPPARRRARSRGPAPPGRPRVRARAAIRRVAAGAARRVTLPELLDDLEARLGPREALVSARRRLTYSGLADESVRIGRALAARGVGKGTRVGLLMPNWPEWIATAFGVWRCGGLLVPLNTLNRPRELGYCLRHADVTVLVAVRAFLRHDYVAALETIAPGVSTTPAPIHHVALPALREIVWFDPPAGDRAVDLAPLLASADRLDAAWPGVLSAEVSPADPATVFFT